MPATRTIIISELLQSDSALTPSAGDRVFSKIVELLEAKEEIYIDFNGINYLNTAFLNAAIGQLYSNYNSDTLNSYLHIINLEDKDLRMVTRVVEGAKEYFANKKRAEDNLKNYLDE